MALILNSICRFLALVTRWSPSGRRVEFRLAEAPNSRLMTRTYFGKIDSVQKSANEGNALLLFLDLPDDIRSDSHETVMKRVIATPRYRGDTIYRLFFGALLVNLAVPGVDQKESDRLLANGHLRIAENTP